MAQIEAIIYNGFHTRSLTPSFIANYYPPGYLLVSGLTSGDSYLVKTNAFNGSSAISVNAVTAGKFTAVGTKGLAPFMSVNFSFTSKDYFVDMPVTSSAASISLFSILNSSSITVATAYMRPVYPYSHGNLANWSITQASDKSVVVNLQSLNSVGSYSVLYSLTDGSNYNSSGGERKPESRAIYTVSLLNNEGTELASNDLHWPKNGNNPVVTFPSSLVTTSGNYVVKISNVIASTESSATTLISLELQTTLTAAAVTSGGSSNMFSWLDNSYWYLTDLQVNLGTRAVTHRQGTIQLRPSDTINFAILFHDGTSGINPQATDIKLAVRSSNNTSPYHFWSAATVSTVTVSGDVYYAITVTASDDDLLSAQAANLLAGSNAAQSLLGEIQWTTTRGTFSSDTFTINVPSEVVREPDV
jgi:hypothetical protein